MYCVPETQTKTCWNSCLTDNEIVENSYNQYQPKPVERGARGQVSLVLPLKIIELIDMHFHKIFIYM